MPILLLLLLLVSVTNTLNASKEIIELCDRSTKSSLTYNYYNTLSSYSPFYSTSTSSAKGDRLVRNESCLLSGALATHNVLDVEVELAGLPGSVRFLKGDLTVSLRTSK